MEPDAAGAPLNGRSFAAEQAAVIASMARAHDKMLRDIYYQKIARGQRNKQEAALNQRVADLEQTLALTQGELVQAKAQGEKPINNSHAAQQAGIVASMARAHEKMLREIYYQKLARGQRDKKEAALNQRVAELEDALARSQAERDQALAKNDQQPINNSHAAQQAGIVASMARAHEKMLREIYYQKLARGQRNKQEAAQSKRIADLEHELAQTKGDLEQSRAAGASASAQQPITNSHAAQQAGIVASMARAHEKMLREIYYQKLARKQTQKALASNASLTEEVERLRVEADTMKNLYEQTKQLAEAGTEHRAVTEELVKDNEALRARLRELDASPAGSAAAAPPAGGAAGGADELQTLKSRAKRLEIENMKLERQLTELTGGTPSAALVPHVPSQVVLPPPLPLHTSPGHVVEDRVSDLEARVRDLEVLASPRAADQPFLPPPPSADHAAATYPTAAAAAAPSLLPPAPAATSSAPFTVRVACDVHGVKHNVRLAFHHQPSMVALVNAVNTCYDSAARASHPHGCPDVPFSLAALQIFDAAQQRWVDLTDAHLSSGALDPQLFSFQQASVWHPDRPGTIPQADLTETWLALADGPARSSAVTAPPPRSVMVVTVFKDMDAAGEGHLTYAAFRNAVARYGLELAGQTTAELFEKVDRRRDGVITRDEWIEHCKEHPRYIETLYFKSVDSKLSVAGPLSAPPTHPQPSAFSPAQRMNLYDARTQGADQRPYY
eukprot:Rhum_TRINITY_DN13030_c0_g1::Rhum_TRINITY_DN13030_c0_g1_i3::g.56465::m.56465